MKALARILLVFCLVWGVSRSAIYFLPGSPAEYLVHESLVQINEETLKKKMDLDAGPVHRIFSFPKNESLIKKDVASHLLSEALKKSFLLTLLTLFFTFTFSGFLLYFSFIKRRGKSISHFISIFFASLPLFVAGPILLRVSSLPNPILPAFVLSIHLTAFWYRALQKKIDSYFPQSSVAGARARGKAESTLFFKDLLAPTLGSFFSYFGTQIGIILNGSLLVEIIFQWNGIGSLLADSVLSRDYPVIELCLITITLITLLSQQLGYYLQSFWEPKLR